MNKGYFINDAKNESMNPHSPYGKKPYEKTTRSHFYRIDRNEEAHHNWFRQMQEEDVVLTPISKNSSPEETFAYYHSSNHEYAALLWKITYASRLGDTDTVKAMELIKIGADRLRNRRR